MKLSYVPYLLEFKHPFGVSSNTRTHTPTVFVRLELDGIYGYGEACLPAYLGESVDDTVSFIQKMQALIKAFSSMEDLEGLRSLMDRNFMKNNAGKAAIDTAYLDLKSKLKGKTLHALFGLDWKSPIITSHTIGIDAEDKMKEKIGEAEDFKILKVKLGTENDKKIIETLRKFTDKSLYVDANQGWKDLGFAVEMSHWLKEKNVLLIEQPLPVDRLEDMGRLTEKSPIPTIADESVKRLCDIERIEGIFSGINIKLMKSGGVSEALEMIRKAKENGMLVMLGCMAESTCATAAMSHLSSLADFVDLDAPTLIKNDPFYGINYRNGSILLEEGPGSGARLKESILNFM